MPIDICVSQSGLTVLTLMSANRKEQEQERESRSMPGQVGLERALEFAILSHGVSTRLSAILMKPYPWKSFNFLSCT
jgi:hypothetical protein